MMTEKAKRYLRYVRKRLRSKAWKNAVLITIFLLLFLYPLINYETLQNKTYIGIFSRGNVLLNNKVDSLNNIDGIILTTYLSYYFPNNPNANALLIEATNNFKIFAHRYLVCGRFPLNQNEILVEAKLTYKVDIGDQIEFNNESYIVVGKVSSGIKNLIGDFPDLLPAIKFTNEPPKRIMATILSIFVFSNYESIISKLEEIFGNDAWINTLSLREEEQSRVFQIFVTTFIATSVASLLSVIDMRSDSAILFSIGWRWKDILVRVYVEYIIINMLSYVGSLTVLYELLSTMKLHLFFNFLVLSPLAMILISLIPVYVFSKYLIVKTGVEVLLE